MARLLFDFPDPASPDTPPRWRFCDPVEVVTTAELGEVRGALARVQERVAAGLHAAGYISYEAAPGFEPAMRVRPGVRLPLVWFGLFPEPDRLEGGAAAATVEATAARLDWRLDREREEHAAAVEAVRDAIAAGRTYQVNLTARLRALLDGDALENEEPFRLYERMRRAQGSGYHAFLDLGRHVILSASPELFFRTRGREIVTRPMKGTRPRGRWPEEDRALERALESSEKDRAENLMIVDLLRNDLGRICETGSIEVTRLHAIERYRTVWQMSSTVAGRLLPNVELTDLFAALFPCGSVTGAPKISTMTEIARLETSTREVYCGAIGWIRPGGDCTFNVPIRTAWLDRETRQVEYGVGGGVVWDSTPEGELDELRAKAVVVREPWPEFELLETLALRNGGFTRRDRHLERMRASAKYFGFPDPTRGFLAALDGLAARHPAGHFLARITFDDDGGTTARAEPLDSAKSRNAPGPIATPPGAAQPGRPERLPIVVLADSAVDAADRFLYHKTTHRHLHDRQRALAPAEAFDVLLYNGRGELTEFTRGNLVVEIDDGQLVTPALACGLLPGCLRQELLDEEIITERVLHRRELARASRLWFINSARGWTEVGLGPVRR